MNKNGKNANLVSVILYSICAVIWLALTVMDLVSGSYQTNTLLFVLHALCTVVWIFCLIVIILRWKHSEKE